MKNKHLTSIWVIVLVLAITLLMSASSAYAQGGNVGSTLVDEFVAKTSGWWSILQQNSLYILKFTAIFQIGYMGINIALNRPQMHEMAAQFVTTMIAICLFAAIIMNYKEWATAIAINGLKPLAGVLGGPPAFDAGSPVAMIFAILDAMVPVLKDAGMFDVGMVMIYVFCMAAITIVFVIICCRYIILICEFHILANVGVLLLGFSGAQVFREYGINVVKYIFSVAIKLFVFQLICNIGFSILSLNTKITGMQGQSIENIDIASLVIIIIQAGILLALASQLPQTCAGLISGSSADGGNPIANMGKMAAGAAAGAVSGGFSSASNFGKAMTVAKQQGASNFFERVAGARAIYSNANMQANPNSMSHILKSQVNAGKAMSTTDKS